MRVVISPKQFARMTDLAAELYGNPSPAADKALVDYQEEIRWPWRATQEQLDEWSRLYAIWDGHLAAALKGGDTLADARTLAASSEERDTADVRRP